MNILCIGVLKLSTPNTVFKTHSTIRCDNTPTAYQTFTHQIWRVMVCNDLAHQIRLSTLLVVGVISHLWCATCLVGIAHHSLYSVLA